MAKPADQMSVSDRLVIEEKGVYASYTLLYFRFFQTIAETEGHQTMQVAKVTRPEPNFFIVGAPKCGTTALSAYLGEHPNILMCTPKEPNFFCDDLPRIRTCTRLEEYLRLFECATADHLAIGEASTWYLYSATAARRIRECFPNARILVMLRNPVDMIYSLHSQFVYNQIEHERDFTKAWRLQPQRRHRPFLQYSVVGRLGEQYERLLEVFPITQVKPVIFDDFISNTAAVYQEVLRFLDVPIDDRTVFPKINENRQLANHMLGRLTKQTPSALVNIYQGVKRALGIKELGLMDRLHRWNTRVMPRQPLNDELRREMQRDFAADIDRLSRLIGRDLSRWATS